MELSSTIAHSENSSPNFFANHFSPRLASAVQKVGYSDPTEIQNRAIPVVLEGKDVLGLAQTGTGKTAAFVLPILERMEGGAKNPSALIVAPTRELAEQILQAIRSFTSGSRVRSVALYGGMSIHGQTQALRGGVDIVVACPGRLLDHVERRTIDLKKITTLVLDEADHMFDMGFLPAIRRIIGMVPKERQTLLFSATMPKEVRQLAMEILREPAIIEVNHTAPKTSVTHSAYPVPQHLKSALTLEILKTISSGSVLIFCRTKRGVKKLVEQLCKAGQKATSLRGNLSQGARRNAIDGFRGGAYRIMVATDIAARGIDISSISHVINYDIPDTIEAYTHRIGRTGRASKIGDAFTLVTKADERMVRNIERILGLKVERVNIEGFDYKAEKIDLPVVKDWESQEELGESRGSDRRRARGGRRSDSEGPRGERRQRGGRDSRFGNRDRKPRSDRSRIPYNRDDTDSLAADSRGESSRFRRTEGAPSRDSRRDGWRGDREQGRGASFKRPGARTRGNSDDRGGYSRQDRYARPDRGSDGARGEGRFNRSDSRPGRYSENRPRDGARSRDASRGNFRRDDEGNRQPRERSSSNSFRGERKQFDRPFRKPTSARTEGSGSGRFQDREQSGSTGFAGESRRPRFKKPFNRGGKRPFRRDRVSE